MEAHLYPTATQRRILWTALTALAVTALVCVAALAFFGFITFLSWSYPILLPLGLAVILALILRPVVDFLEYRGLHRQPATLLVCVLTVFAILGFWAFLLPPLVAQGGELLSRAPAMIDNVVTHVQDSFDARSPAPVIGRHRGAPAVAPPVPTTNAPTVTPEMKTWVRTNLAEMQQDLPKNVAHIFYAGLGPVGQAIGFLLGFGFVPIYVYYFLADQDHLSKHWHEFVPLRQGKFRDEVIGTLTEINKSLVSYLRGQIIVAVCNGVLICIGLTAIGVPYSLALGAIAGALSIVPFLGIIASIIPALVLAFLSANGDPTWEWLGPLLVLAVFGIAQMSESMLITPRVQSHSTGLHPLVIILGILVWSMLLPGLLGPVVAVPLTCAIVVVLRRYVWQEKRRRNAPAV